MAVDLVGVPAVSRLPARSLCRVLGTLVRHAPRAARGELCLAAAGRAPEVPQFLHRRALRYLRRLPHLRAVTLTSRDNPKVRHWAKLARDHRYRKAQGRALLEGPHLVEAFRGKAV